MSATPTVVVAYGIEGMNDSVHPSMLGMMRVARMTNCQIKNQTICTRPGVFEHKLGDDAKPYKEGNIQGAAFYNPTRGQSQQIFGTDTDSLVVAASGRKFHVTFSKSGDPVFSDETAGILGTEDAHLVYLYQAENYIIAQDGISNTWIWDGIASAVPSPGFDPDKPEDSWLANAATVGVFAHGRIAQVVGGNRILVGNIIHSNGQNDPVAILKMAEQVYYATGSYFSPPSGMGEILAVGILPLSNTVHGHDDVVFHCRGGCFSLKLDHFPRSQWAEVAISKHLLIDSSAAGPYALTIYDGDQMFRSRHGLQTIKSAASDTAEVGSPNRPISEPVSSWMKSDKDSLLRFSSVAKWGIRNRVLVTTGLWLDGSHRGGKGIVSLNLAPLQDQSSRQRSWEGLWTLPEKLGRPIQLVNGTFSDNDRMFVLSHANKCEAENKILEFIPYQRHDKTVTGEIIPISSQVITSEVPPTAITERHQLAGGVINFDDIHGDFEWGVWVRNTPGDEWTLWQRGKITDSGPTDALADSKGRRLRQNLSDCPRPIKNGPKFQFLVRWRGYAEFVGFVANLEKFNGEETPQPDANFVGDSAPCGYDDYEYAKGVNW
jgi:hypothetical protein